MKSFLSRFGSLISFCLSGFDRIRLRGDSRRLNNTRGVDCFLYSRNIRYVDFPKYALALTGKLCDATEQQAEAEGVPLKHLNSPTIDKEATALQLAQKQRRNCGRIALLSSVELCDTYRLRRIKPNEVRVLKERGKCLHYYHYFLHENFGLCYVRVQSWFPFTVRIGLNGRQWLYRQLEQRGVPFSKRNNLLVSVANPDLAQELLNEQCQVDWPVLLNELVQPIQPLWSYLQESGDSPYWTGEQTEWATDFIFHRPEELALWYPRWIRHGIETLQCRDVLRFLGKKLPKQGYGVHSGEAKIDLRERVEGTRLKFWYKGNSEKMYDKEGLGLRVETTLNQPKDFRVYRTKEGAEPGAPKAWHPLRKGVADMERRAEVCNASNQRLIESLATVAETQSLGTLLQPLGRPVVKKGRPRARALNPLTGADGELLRMLADGKYLIQGFRNQDIRQARYGVTKEDAERRRQAAAVTRQLSLLRAHGIIVKVPKSHRYHLSASGRRIVTALLAAHASDVNWLMQSA
jgi:hypothetical protein